MCAFFSPPIGPYLSFSSTDRSPLTPRHHLSPSTSQWLPGGAAPPRTPGRTPHPHVGAPQHQAPPRSPTHLLDVLLEDTELQPLVEPHLAVLPDVLQLPLVVQHLVDDVQGRGARPSSSWPRREPSRSCGASGAAGACRAGDFRPGSPARAGHRRAIISQRVLQKRGSAQANATGPTLRGGRPLHQTHAHLHTHTNCKSEFHSKACFIKTK